MNHVWGLLVHPGQEMRHIRRENETVSHHYMHHVLLMALIPVICAFVGTTQIGWDLGAPLTLPLSLASGRVSGIVLCADSGGGCGDGPCYSLDGTGFSTAP